MTIHRRVRGAIHNAITRLEAGQRPALIGGGEWTSPRGRVALAQFTQAAGERGFDVYLEGDGLYLRERTQEGAA